MPDPDIRGTISLPALHHLAFETFSDSITLLELMGRGLVEHLRQ